MQTISSTASLLSDITYTVIEGNKEIALKEYWTDFNENWVTLFKNFIFSNIEFQNISWNFHAIIRAIDSNTLMIMYYGK